MKNRRKYLRYPTSIKVKYRELSDSSKNSKWDTGIMLNAGENGAFIMCNSPLKKNSKVEIEIPVKEGKIILQAKVRWISTKPPNGVGVKFLRVKKEIREKIKEELTSGRWLKPEIYKENKKNIEILLEDITEILKEL